MNRLIIIGNGFDLAHGLKTSYNHFMEFIKSDIENSESRTSNNGSIYKYKEKILDIDNPYIAILKNEATESYEFAVYDDIYNNGNKSKYFRTLFENYNETKNWCDLEQLYYDLLKECMTVQHYLIDLINKEFDYLKVLLESYLENEIEKKIENLDIENDNNILIQKSDQLEVGKLIAVVNFNYTKKIIRKLVDNYTKFSERNSYNQKSNEFKLLNIHGEFSSKENPIIFGYGDDNSEEYKAIQDAKKDELLKNFKTFQYLRNSNYQSVLAILAVNKDITVEIIGHSCGLTDRTLLKTIFEHPNVKKIEYLYHENESNYFKNLYSLSRIFTSNELFREKVKFLEDTRNMTEIIVKL